MRDFLVNLLESLGYPVFLQGTLNSESDYPESFFTYWVSQTDDESFYSGNPMFSDWSFWVYFYSTDAALVETESTAARQLLKENGFIVQGKPIDADSGTHTHTGMMLTALYMERYDT